MDTLLSANVNECVYNVAKEPNVVKYVWEFALDVSKCKRLGMSPRIKEESVYRIEAQVKTKGVQKRGFHF